MKGMVYYKATENTELHCANTVIVANEGRVYEFAKRDAEILEAVQACATLKQCGVQEFAAQSEADEEVQEEIHSHTQTLNQLKSAHGTAKGTVKTQEA